MATAALLCGATLRAVSLGSGPVVFRFTVRDIEWRIGIFVLGGYVQLWRSGDEAPEGAVRFDDLSLPRRELIFLSGVLALFLGGCALGGGGLLFREAAEGVLDMLRGAASPTKAGPALLHRAAEASRALPFRALLSLVLVKVAAWNALPVPSYSGGSALLELLPGAWNARPKIVAQIVGALAGVTVVISWVIALGVYLVG